MRLLRRTGASCPTGPVAGVIGILAIAALCALPAARGEVTAEDPYPVDMGMTVNALGDVSANDAVAAFTTYANNFAADIGLTILMKATVFDSLAGLRYALDQGRLQVTGLQIQEYIELREHVPLDLLFKTERSGTTMERYVILVQANSSVTDLSALRNSDFRMLTGTHMGLTKIWLDTLLMEDGLPTGSDYFSRVTEEKTASLVVLPVFFGKADACLVNLRGFETMTEMNPQVGQQLRVLLESPEFVPFVICMRHDFTGRYREQTERAYLEAHLNTRGQQALMLFRYDRMLLCTEEDLESARALIDRHQRLLNHTEQRP